MDRTDRRIAHSWHVAVNRFNSGKIGKPDEWRGWMYEALRAADEVPRLAVLFGMERRHRLPTEHRQCSQYAPERVPNEHLTCCLGVKCAECPELLALDAMEPPATLEAIDTAKAWTCVAHIIASGGDHANEGYVLTVSDRMFWDSVHANLAADERGEEE